MRIEKIRHAREHFHLDVELNEWASTRMYGVRCKSCVISTSSVNQDARWKRKEKINSMFDTTTKQPPFVSAPLYLAEIALGMVAHDVLLLVYEEHKGRLPNPVRARPRSWLAHVTRYAGRVARKEKSRERNCLQINKESCRSLDCIAIMTVNNNAAGAALAHAAE